MAYTCELCDTEIEYPADVCERHALTSEQLAELGRRITAAQREYYLELWPELAGRW